MEIQRLRNLTTGRLHTKIECVYQDLELITGEQGLMTHMLPRMNEAIKPWLRKHVKDKRFWNDKYDPTHVGEYDLPEPTLEDRSKMIANYMEKPDPLEGKKVIVVKV